MLIEKGATYLAHLKHLPADKRQCIPELGINVSLVLKNQNLPLNDIKHDNLDNSTANNTTCVNLNNDIFIGYNTNKPMNITTNETIRVSDDYQKNAQYW